MGSTPPDEQSKYGRRLEALIEMNLWDDVIERLTSDREMDEVRNGFILGSLPIHWAARYNAPENVINRLLSIYPEGAQKTNRSGKLPIHLAAEYSTSLEVIERLVEAYPEGVQQPDNDGWLPIHHAAEFNASFHIIERLIGSNPEGIRQRTQSGEQLLFHRALTDNQYIDFHEKNVLKATYSEEVTQGQSPPSMPSLEALIRIHKWDAVLERLATEKGMQEASSCIGYFKMYPIHFALKESDLPLCVLDVLLKSSPEGARTQNRNGSIPLHLASRYSTSVEIINHLIQAYPEGARRQNKFKTLPIHCAAACNTSVHVMDRLLEAYPDGVHQQDNSGKLPIHYAAAMYGEKSSIDVIKWLITIYPKGLQQEDNKGKLPIHHAAENSEKESVDVLECLINTYPEGVQHRDNFGKLPIHHAAANHNKNSLKQIECLIKAYLEGARQTDCQRRLPIHNLCESGFIDNVENFIMRLRLLLEANPEHIMLTCLPSLSDLASTYSRPVEIAVTNNFPSEVITFLLEEEEMYFISLAQIIVKRQEKGIKLASKVVSQSNLE